MNYIERQGPLLPFAGFALQSLMLFALSRLFLCALYANRVVDTGVLLQVMLFGLRMDGVLLAMVLLIPVLLTLALPGQVTEKSPWQWFIRSYLGFWFFIFAFMELSTPLYVAFFDTRPARIFFEYIGHPVEVGRLLMNGFAWQSMVIVTLSVCITVAAFLNIGRWQGKAKHWSYLHKLLSLPAVLLLLVLIGRSTLDHRPVNASTVAFSNDQLLNELPLNSTYTLLNALYRLGNEGDPAALYPAMSEQEIIHRVRRMSLVESNQFDEPSFPTVHRVGRQDTSKPKNLVILLEESLGAQFVGKLGGLPLTPELDQLAEQGLWFENLYATGIRSARGIEAVITGFPPSPSRSVLKLGLAQTNFYTMARSLKDNGYKNYFIYGGESQFDNMKGFMLNNGFDVAIDEKDYDQWRFKGSWGVSDEDLFDKAHGIFERQQQPFFALVFSSSFHSPFEIPEGRVEPYEVLDENNNQSPLNAVKYADYALGRFIRMAKQSSYWQDTLFLIVADHDERPRGSSLVPVKNYHIPGLILGSGIAARKYTKVTSQIDLLPTLYQLLGIATHSPAIGQNIFLRAEDYPGRAVMQFGNNHAYMFGDQVVIHRPHQLALQFVYSGKLLSPVPVDPELAADALAMALLPGLLYQKRWYRLPAK